MNSGDAAQLIAPAVRVGQRWADLGAGTGTFTAALARLIGPAGVVYTVERDEGSARALETLAHRRDVDSARIHVVRADFTEPLNIPQVDGVLLANALHFVNTDDQPRVLRGLADGLLNEGIIVIVEYDNRPPSRWVPHPVSLKRLMELAHEAQLSVPELIGQRRSEYGGRMYAARLGRH